jgi:hypothetical protein
MSINKLARVDPRNLKQSNPTPVSKMPARKKQFRWKKGGILCSAGADRESFQELSKRQNVTWQKLIKLVQPNNVTNVPFGQNHNITYD